MKKKAYVSGPYTKGDPCVNVHNAVMASNKLMDAGFVVFCPHLSHFWHSMTPRPYEDWMEIDLAFLPACDFLIRLPGDSKGADIEVAEARKAGLRVYYSMEDLLKNERP